jgi:hypothetical protein
MSIKKKILFISLVVATILTWLGLCISALSSPYAAGLIKIAYSLNIVWLSLVLFKGLKSILKDWFNNQ